MFGLRMRCCTVYSDYMVCNEIGDYVASDFVPWEYLRDTYRGVRLSCVL